NPIALCEAAVDAARARLEKQQPADPVVSIPPSTPATVQPPELASCPDILGAFLVVVVGRGLVGEDRFAKCVYLALTSRVLGRPVSIVAKGPSSAGKSFVVQQVTEFFPP